MKNDEGIFFPMKHGNKKINSFEDMTDSDIVWFLDIQLETILDSTTFLDRVMEPGRKLEIVFGHVCYCQTMPKDEINPRLGKVFIESNPETGDNWVKTFIDESKNLNFVTPRENMIPNKEQKQKRDNLLTVIRDATKTLKDMGILVHKSPSEIPEGVYKTMTTQGELEAERAKLKDAHKRIFDLEFAAKRIAGYSSPSDVMKLKGNEWLNYAQALEYTIKEMRLIATFIIR